MSVSDFFLPAKRMRPAMPAEIVLKECYHNKEFLKALSNQADDSPVDWEKYVLPAQKIVKRLSASSLTIKYHQVEYYVGNNQKCSVGRYYPVQRFPCNQSLPGVVRRLVADNKYVEVDLGNAHPTILMHFFPEKDSLRMYIENRSEILSQVVERCGVSEADAKELFIRLVFGGSISAWRSDHQVAASSRLPDFVIRFGNDISEIMLFLQGQEWFSKYSKIAQYRSNSTKFRGKRWETTAMSLWLQDVEAEMMVLAISELQRQGVEAASLIHDGVLISADSVVNLDALNDAVRSRSGIALATFKIKPLPISESDEEFRASVLSNCGTEQFTDRTACLHFLNHLDELGHKIVKCGDYVYMYDPEEGIYTERTKQAGFRKILGETPDLGVYSESTAKQSALLTQFYDHIPIDNDFLSKAARYSVMKIPFKNGVYDFATGKLVPFSPDTVFFHKPSFDYVVNDRVEQLIVQIWEKVLIPVWGESAEYVLMHTARCIAGCVTDKRFVICIGFMNSGKGVYCELLCTAFPGLVGSYTSSNLLVLPNNGGDQAKAKSWLLALSSNRLVFSNELPISKNSEIDGNTIKEMSSGGDLMTARSNNKDEVSFRLQCMPWLFVNDLPKIRAIETDTAVAGRLRVVSMPSQFLPAGSEYESKKHMPGVVLGDDWVKDVFVKDPEVGQAFAILITRYFRPYITPDCDAVMEETEQWTKKSSKDNFLHKYIEKGEPSHFLNMNEIESFLKANGHVISPAVLGKNLKREFGLKDEDIKRSEIDGEKVRVYYGIRFKVFNAQPSSQEEDGEGDVLAVEEVDSL